MSEILPHAVQRFLRRYVRGVDDLDVLVTISRERRPWTVEELAALLHTTEASVRMALEQLSAAGMARLVDGEYWFDPADAARRALAAEVVGVYRTHKTRVNTFIYSRPSSGVRAFADAFRFRQSEEEDE